MSEALASTRRLRLHFSGIVQGIGFRPAIWRLATGLQLAGFVRNRPDGVVVEIEGPEARLREFRERLDEFLPAAALIRRQAATIIPATGENGFAIRESRPAASRDFPVGPDLALCAACRAELHDPTDRRFRYPFINCTACGPRLTIVREPPYDRERTAMADFPLCAACRDEYEDPGSRRFHAEAITCPECGPKLFFTDPAGRNLAAQEGALELAARRLRAGEIIAIKGLGGFHLAVAADNETAVARLRQRKTRPEKPFALMARDLETIRRLARLDLLEENLLTGPEAPIVLLRRRAGSETGIAAAVAPGMSELGFMLPYTPLHELLLQTGPELLVMTSGNLSDEPIAIANREARKRLAGIADGFLLHDREIIVRLDDSVAAVIAGRPRLVRRSRGFAPRPLEISPPRPAVLALGGELKNTACLLSGDKALIGPHSGDLETPGAREFFAENLARLQEIAGCRFQIIACDRHPGYHTSAEAARLARRYGVPLIAVQHHHAHIVSCLAENCFPETETVLGLAMDGTGYGDDGHIWGGEFLEVTAAGFTRLGQITYFPLPGGEKAIRQPWRSGLALLAESFPDKWLKLCRKLELAPGDWPDERLRMLLSQTVNRPLTSSLGRLFDAVSALLGICREAGYEGQAAIALEAAACNGAGNDTDAGTNDNRETPALERFAVIEKEKPAPGGRYLQLDPRPAISSLVNQRLAGVPVSRLARAWHETVVTGLMELAAGLCRERELSTIALSGGCFQNRRLLEGCLKWPANNPQSTGLTLLTHSEIPANDGGLALGQAVAAAAIWSANHE